MENIKIYYPNEIKDTPLYEAGSESSTKDTGVESQDTISPTEIPYNLASDVINASLDTQKRRILADYGFSESGAIQIGKYVSGSSGDIRISPNGLVGRNTAGTTTFSIDGTTGNATFLGTISAGSVVTGYLIVGGAIADVNAGSTTINPARVSISGLTTFTSGYDPSVKAVTFAQAGIPTSLAIGDLWMDTDDSNKLYRAASVGANEILAGEWVAVPDGYKLDKVGGTYVSSAAATAKVQIFPDANTGIIAYTSDGTTVVFKVEVGGTNVGDVTLGNYAGGIGALWDQSAGTLTVKGTGFTAYGTAGDAFKFYDSVGGSLKGSMGYLSGSTAMYIVTGADSDLFISATNDAFLVADGGILIQADNDSSGSGNVSIQGNYATIRSNAANNSFYLYSGSDYKQILIQDTGGTTSIQRAGSSAKTAIVETSQGYKALYCTESPEVWFMDFYDSKEKIDPMFLEVTEKPYHYIKCEDGEYQVWGKRKGFGGKRFESKDKNEFHRNNAFWSIPRIPRTKKVRQTVRFGGKKRDFVFDTIVN